MANTIFYTCPPCPECGEMSTVQMTQDQFNEWISFSRRHIQDIFPDKSSADRELIKTGFHSECWDKVMEEELDGL